MIVNSVIKIGLYQGNRNSVVDALSPVNHIGLYQGNRNSVVG